MISVNMYKSSISETRDALNQESSDALEPSSPKQPTSKVVSDGPSRGSIIWMVVFSGLAIGSDGFNASIIGNVELLMEVIYPESLTTAVASRLSNAFMVGMIIGMLCFGYISDKIGRKTGAVLTTTILVLGIALSAGANGINEDGMFWMLIIARGIAGVGAGGFVSIRFDEQMSTNISQRIPCCGSGSCRKH